jgi:hypothetical protein
VLRGGVEATAQQDHDLAGAADRGHALEGLARGVHVGGPAGAMFVDRRRRDRLPLLRYDRSRHGFHGKSVSGAMPFGPWHEMTNLTALPALIQRSQASDSAVIRLNP